MTEEIGKQLKTIEAKIVNGFLIKKGEILFDSALRVKDIQSIELYRDTHSVNLACYGMDITYSVLNNASLEDIIIELGVHL